MTEAAHVRANKQLEEAARELEERHRYGPSSSTLNPKRQIGVAMRDRDDLEKQLRTFDPEP